MEMTITRVVYHPSTDVADGDIIGRDDKTETRTLEFGDVMEAVTCITSDGLSMEEGSDWFSLPDGTQPHGWDGNYTGVVEEVTMHYGDDTDAVERAMVTAGVAAYWVELRRIQRGASTSLNGGRNLSTGLDQ